MFSIIKHSIHNPDKTKKGTTPKVKLIVFMTSIKF
jgi:hypothetical protein